jgi:hypothetical protein
MALADMGGEGKWDDLGAWPFIVGFSHNDLGGGWRSLGFEKRKHSHGAHEYGKREWPFGKSSF